jgi:hypothetical protein
VTLQADEVEVEEALPRAPAAGRAALPAAPDRAGWPGIIEQSVSAAGTAIVFAFVGHLGGGDGGRPAPGNFLPHVPVCAARHRVIAIVSRRWRRTPGEGRRDGVPRARCDVGVLFRIGRRSPPLPVSSARERTSSRSAPFRSDRASSARHTRAHRSAMRAEPRPCSPVSIVFSVTLAYVLDVFGVGAMGARSFGGDVGALPHRTCPAPSRDCRSPAARGA